MKIEKNGTGFITAALLFSLVDPSPQGAGARLPALSDVTQALKDISGTLEGIRSFMSGIAFISKTIGYETILLFIFVIIFSIGFSSIGVPRGKASFLVSLTAVDALWVLWKASVNARFADFFPQMLKSSLIVLSPLIVVAILARIFPLLLASLKNTMLSPFRRMRVFSKKRLAGLHQEFRARSEALDGCIRSEMAGTDDEKITLSSVTIQTIEELKSTLTKLHAGKH
jgi:hypothetical protein